MSTSGSTWLVLGATSPVSRAFALVAGEHGAGVVLAGRDTEALEATAADLKVRTGEPVHVLRLDAEEIAKHDKFVEDCLALRDGTLNVFLAFGVMPDQEAIDSNFDLAFRTMNVNYVGAVSILSRLAPILEEQQGGRIIVLGSTAGDRGRLKNYVYGSSKAGLHTYLQGLRARLSRSGVSVTTVKPGFVDTSMTWGQSLKLPAANPQRLAQACWRLAEKGADVAYYPWFWKPIMTLIKLIPERVAKRVRF